MAYAVKRYRGRDRKAVRLDLSLQMGHRHAAPLQEDCNLPGCGEDVRRHWEDALDLQKCDQNGLARVALCRVHEAQWESRGMGSHRMLSRER